MSTRVSTQGTGQLNCEGPFLGRRDDPNMLSMEEAPSKGIAWERSDSGIRRHLNLTIWKPKTAACSMGSCESFMTLVWSNCDELTAFHP